MQATLLTKALENPALHWMVFVIAGLVLLIAALLFVARRSGIGVTVVRLLVALMAVGLIVISPFHFQAVSNRYDRGELVARRLGATGANVFAAVAALVLLRQSSAIDDKVER